MTTRRELMAALAAPALALAAKGKPLGVQLYTIRGLVPAKARESLQALAQIGFKEVETLRSIHATVLPLCKEFGLKPVAAHFETAIISGQYDSWKGAFPNGKPAGYNWMKAIEEAQAAGIKYMVLPYVQVADRGGPEVYQRLAKQINEAGEQCAKAGLQLCYHQHAFEFGEVQGKRPWDILLAETDPRTMALELDVFWVAVAGLDPAAMIRQLKGRVKLLHLKDKAPGVAKQYTEVVTPGAFREVGLGTLDFPGILKAAGEMKVEHYFVEQDQVAGDPIESVRTSYKNLTTKLGF
jgi:sugar phosphate isomerase/epimerase